MNNNKNRAWIVLYIVTFVLPCVPILWRRAWCPDSLIQMGALFNLSAIKAGRFLYSGDEVPSDQSACLWPWWGRRAVNKEATVPTIKTLKHQILIAAAVATTKERSNKTVNHFICSYVFCRYKAVIIVWQGLKSRGHAPSIVLLTTFFFILT